VTRELGPGLNSLEESVWHHLPRRHAMRAGQIADEVGEDLDVVVRTLHVLAQLGYVTAQASGWWRRA
jgi:hypothetical protein